MPKYFIDTNVFLDQALSRSRAEIVYDFFLRCINQKLDLITSISCIQTVLYILEKEKVDREDRYKAILRLNELVDQAPTSRQAIATAMQSNFKDMEDAILYYTAVENGCDAFVTQNVTDFPSHDLIPVFTPAQMIFKFNEEH